MKIKIQNIVFPKDTVCDKEELYYRKIGIPTTSEILGETIVFKNHQRLNFDTYFNSLSLLKWTTYTKVSNVSLNITLKGKFRVNLIHMFLEGGGRLNYKILKSEEVESSNKKEFLFDYITENPFGMLTFNLESLSEGSTFFGASYVSEVDEQDVNDVKLGIGICTFKRESYVYNNINNLKTYIFSNKNSTVKNDVEVFISDNAGTLEEEKTNCNNVHVYKNKNTGGSGGFTRCMIEAINFNKTAKTPLTHLILMDDDVKFDPTSIERVYSLLALLKPEYGENFIGGAMVKMNAPEIQHASGEFWHGERCQSFVETYNSNRNLTDIKQILENENFTNANYQAWWFCAIPMTFVREDNLSMPFFIKSDDIEFSMRNKKRPILLNGINVWHESFESKYSAQNEYYTVRNYLISAASKKAGVTKEDILTMLKVYTKHYICNYKYLEIEHFCNAINDFLAGVDHFKTIDLESYHKNILAKGYKMVDANKLPVKFTDDKYFRDISYLPNLSRLKTKFRKYTINGLLLPSNGFAVLGMWGGSYPQTYRKKFLVRYEINTKKGFILKRSLKKTIKCYNLYRKTKRNVEKNFDKAFNEFATRWQELCTLENWKNYLDLNK